MFSHFSGHEEGFIIEIALNDGLNMQIDKPPSYGRTASFVSPWSYTNSGLRFFAGFLRCSLHDWKRGNWVTLLAILRHSRASATGKAVIAMSWHVVMKMLRKDFRCTTTLNSVSTVWGARGFWIHRILLSDFIKRNIIEYHYFYYSSSWASVFASRLRSRSSCWICHIFVSDRGVL